MDLTYGFSFWLLSATFATVTASRTQCVPGTMVSPQSCRVCICDRFGWFTGCRNICTPSTSSTLTPPHVVERNFPSEDSGLKPCLNEAPRVLSDEENDWEKYEEPDDEGYQNYATSKRPEIQVPSEGKDTDADRSDMPATSKRPPIQIANEDTSEDSDDQDEHEASKRPHIQMQGEPEESDDYVNETNSSRPLIEIPADPQFNRAFLKFLVTSFSMNLFFSEKTF